MKTIKCDRCNGTGIEHLRFFRPPGYVIDFECAKCKGKGYIKKLEIKKFMIYLLRWQLSTPVLALCLYILPFKTIISTILANFIGGCIFYWIDKKIFKDKDKS